MFEEHNNNNNNSNKKKTFLFLKHSFSVDFRYCLPFTFSIIVISFILCPVNGFYTQNKKRLTRTQRMQSDDGDDEEVEKFCSFPIHWRVRFLKSELYCVDSMAKCLRYPLRVWKNYFIFTWIPFTLAKCWEEQGERERQRERALEINFRVLNIHSGKWFFLVYVKIHMITNNNWATSGRYCFCFPFVPFHALRT